MSATQNMPRTRSPMPGPFAEFLAKRIAGEAGHCGRSSDAMVSAAVLGRKVSKGEYPLDLGDLGRCCEAFALAPYELRKRMLPILREYLAAMDEWQRDWRKRRAAA
jgi:hypothetical protein